MFNLLQLLWSDEAGYLLSAEAVTVGTLGVVGATVGIGAVSKSVNDELTETAYAIRSLDQSFTVPQQRGAGAWTAGSVFIQPDVEQAHADLGRYLADHGGTPLAIAPRTERPAAAGEVLPDEQARRRRQPLENRSFEEREELRRIRQRKRREQRLLSEQPEAPSPADVE